jgi:hypothetical protein
MQHENASTFERAYSLKWLTRFGRYNIWLTCVSSDDNELECAEVVEEAARLINAFIAVCHLKPFPPDTDGFLYYYNPPKAPPCVGEIHFRLASDLDSFHNGKDLLSPGPDNFSKTAHFALAAFGCFSSGKAALVDLALVMKSLAAPASSFPAHSSGCFGILDVIKVYSFQL